MIVIWITSPKKTTFWVLSTILCGFANILTNHKNCSIMNGMEKEIIHTSPSNEVNRYPVMQEQIDDILKNELKDFEFPVKPIYNPRIRANGITKGEIYGWGQLKQIKSIEIGKQDTPDKKFLIDTLLHEYYEAEIMKKQYEEDFFKKLSRAGDTKRHNWIKAQINKFFQGMEGQK